MPKLPDDAKARFRRMMTWIAIAAVLMVAGALWYLSLFEPLRLHMVIATILGVFFSVLLGSGLFAAAFFSDRSGHDQQVTDATQQEGK
ncbi:hypothetical protein [Sphingomonas sp.]|uniref:hypothetical protein n=1 Tax=Sphingomonas sp. TaxID=28214 RepID=UPI002DD692A6|nr:hypothetical protein [Sphingomonas sp.]